MYTKIPTIHDLRQANTDQDLTHIIYSLSKK